MSRKAVSLNSAHVLSLQSTVTNSLYLSFCSMSQENLSAHLSGHLSAHPRGNHSRISTQTELRKPVSPHFRCLAWASDESSRRDWHFWPVIANSERDIQGKLFQLRKIEQGCQGSGRQEHSRSNLSFGRTRIIWSSVRPLELILE